MLLARRAARRRQSPSVVAPGNPYLGVMLPYTPLHHLLLGDFGRPVVATSGNLSDEPICTDEREALERLGGIADLFLVHDRPIVRHVDDSVVRVMLGRELVLRRARGYAPLPLPLGTGGDGAALLAVGGHLKNTVALSVGVERLRQPAHRRPGDARGATPRSRRGSTSFSALYAPEPAAVAADLHPDYASTQLRPRARGCPSSRCSTTTRTSPPAWPRTTSTAPVLGVAWDGTGYGPDGTVWGGEFLRADRRGFTRVARARPLRLPGGERAVKEPRRSALGVLYAMLGPGVRERRDLAPVRAFTRRRARRDPPDARQGVNAPVTSSAGRLFDAVAALAGCARSSSFEGQAAMELEFASTTGAETGDAAYPVANRGGSSRRARTAPRWSSTGQPIVQPRCSTTSARGVGAGRWRRGSTTPWPTRSSPWRERVGEPRVVADRRLLPEPRS